MNSVRSDSCLTRTNAEELKQVVNIQRSVITTYRDQLASCQSSLCKIRQTNDFDVDELLKSMIHTDDDVTQYRNAILFMKNKLDFVLPDNS